MGCMIKKSLETTDLQNGRENLAVFGNFISLSLQLDYFLVGLILTCANSPQSHCTWLLICWLVCFLVLAYSRSFASHPTLL